MKYILKESQFFNILQEESDNNSDIEIRGKIIDPSNLTDDEKKELKLKEKVFLEKGELDYPIVLVQLKNGQVIMFDVNGEIIDSEENKEEFNEYARTLKNARRQGVGLRFPKSAVKNSPKRFRPQNRKTK